MFIELKTNKGYSLINMDLFTNVESVRTDKEGENIAFFTPIQRKRVGIHYITTERDFNDFMDKVRSYQKKP